MCGWLQYAFSNYGGVLKKILRELLEILEKILKELRIYFVESAYKDKF